MGRTRKHVINLTLKSKSKVVSGSWLYATHRLMVIHPCVIYRKPMSNQIKSYGPEMNLHRQTDRQSDSYIPPWTSFTGGIIRLIAHFVHGYYQIDKGVFLCMVFSSKISDIDCWLFLNYEKATCTYIHVVQFYLLINFGFVITKSIQGVDTPLYHAKQQVL